MTTICHVIKKLKNWILVLLHFALASMNDLDMIISMKNMKTIKQEINQIRLSIYEKTKDMTPTQLTNYNKKNTDAAIKKYGFRVIASAKDKK